jgi:NADH-quinone oxidoreductase subunit D
MVGVGYLDLTGCMALGITGPVLRSTGLPHDLRKPPPTAATRPTTSTSITRDTCDSYDRMRIRLDEMYQSLRIVEQCADRLQASTGEPVMVADKKIAWPAQLAIGADGMGNSLDHIREIMGSRWSRSSTTSSSSPRASGCRPARRTSRSRVAKGELGCHLVSDGGTRPYRAHFRDPSFNNLQATAIMCEGGQVADVIVAVASIDPVMGGVDR